MSCTCRNAFAGIAVVAIVVGLATPSAAEKIHLRDGHSLSRSGDLKTGHSKTYEFAGKKGQSLNVNFFATKGDCGFDIYQPGMAVPMFLGGTKVGAFSGKLPKDGDYGVKIRGGACSYEVTFKIRG